MRTRIKIFSCAVAVLVIGVAVRLSWPSKEPLYKGRTVRQCLNKLTWRSGERDQALRFFGTNSVPCIRAELRAKDHLGRSELAWIGARMPGLRVYLLSATDEHRFGLNDYLHIVQANDWGVANSACVPEVRALTNDPASDVAAYARYVLDIIASKERESSGSRKP
jgi:hypothetical protein